MKLQVLDIKGAKASDIDLNDKVWAIEPNNQAMFDTVIAQQAALRQATAKVKTRAEVSGGGVKPWRQKGTGRARQGSIRAPQWKGGGVAFGPRGNANYKLTVNKKVKALAFKSALSIKAKDNNLVIVDKFGFSKPSTKQMVEALKALKVDGQKVLIVVKDDDDMTALKSASNIENVVAMKREHLNMFDLMNATKLVLTADAAKDIEGVWA